MSGRWFCVVLCTLSAVALQAAAPRLEGYATIGRSGNTLSSAASATFIQDDPYCMSNCSYRIHGTHEVLASNGNAVLHINWFSNTFSYRRTETRTVSPGLCFTASNEAVFTIVSGTPSNFWVDSFGSIPFPADVMEAGPWHSNTLCYQSSPPPPPPPVESCDHCGTTMEPLVLDLDGNGILTTTKSGNPVWFDLNGNGVPDLTAWTAPGEEDAFLFVDWNGNRSVDGGQELFGDATVMPNGVRARNGYEALAAYDDPANGGNDDGSITRADAIWSRLRLWVDHNHDGLLSHDEDQNLNAAGVVAIPLQFRVMGEADDYGADAHGNQHHLQGEYSRRVHGQLQWREMHEIYFVAEIR